MEIVVVHMTRMAPGYCCVAGYDIKTGRAVRALPMPIPRQDPRLDVCHLTRFGGVFSIGAVIELGITRGIPKPPEVEDIFFEPHQAKQTRTLSPLEFWNLISEHAKSNFADIFGDELKPRGGASFVVEQGKGKASLGLIKLMKPPKLSVSKGLGEQKIRLGFGIGDHWANLSVTDSRLYRDDCATPDSKLVDEIGKKARPQVFTGGVILALGLTRPFAEDQSSPGFHWLQVNNIFLRNDPYMTTLLPKRAAARRDREEDAEFV